MKNSHLLPNNPPHDVIDTISRNKADILIAQRDRNHPDNYLVISMEEFLSLLNINAAQSVAELVENADIKRRLISNVNSRRGRIRIQLKPASDW